MVEGCGRGSTGQQDLTGGGGDRLLPGGAGSPTGPLVDLAAGAVTDIEPVGCHHSPARVGDQIGEVGARRHDLGAEGLGVPREGDLGDTQEIALRVDALDEQDAVGSRLDDEHALVVLDRNLPVGVRVEPGRRRVPGPQGELRVEQQVAGCLVRSGIGDGVLEGHLVQQVVAGTAGDLIGPAPARNVVGTVATLDDIASPTTAQQIIAALAGDDVGPAQPGDDIPARGALQGVGSPGTDDRGGLTEAGGGRRTRNAGEAEKQQGREDGGVS